MSNAALDAGPAQTLPLSGPSVDLLRYREVFERLGTGFCVIQMMFEGDEAVDYRFIEVNDAFEHATGLRDVCGQTIGSLGIELEQEWLVNYGKVARDGTTMRFEREARGAGRWYLVEAVRIGNPAEHLVGVLFFDITGRKQMELQLAESEMRFSALADGLPMPVWVLDSTGHVRFVNSAFSEFFGTDEAVAGDRWWDGLVHPEDCPAFTYELDIALREHREMHVLVRARRHDGQWRWLEMNAVPRHGSNGRFIGMAGNSPDVTERREIELAREQLLQSERVARNVAESTARLKDEFLATLSHELRTPLTTILGWAELLLQRVEPGNPLHKGLGVIASSAVAQKRLISDMLDLSSMLLGKVQLEVEVIDLGDLLGDAVRAQEPSASEKQQAITLQRPDDACLVLGDPTRLQQVFWNLLSNAIKFTPEQGRIEVELQHEADHYLVLVHDDGDGIAPDFLEHLFTRFRQADGTTTRRHGGLGLGLAIVRQLVELHGGVVSASSEGTGHGSTFMVRLPVHQPAADGRPRRQVMRGPIMMEQVVAPDALQGLRVLAVEDQPAVLEYLCRILQQQGAEVTAAGSAVEALALLDDDGRQRFDVLLTDIGMPGMDGYGLVRTLRENLGVDASMLPAVAVTALARADDRRMALAAGFQEHVPKPYSVAQLVSAIRGVAPAR